MEAPAPRFEMQSTVQGDIELAPDVFSPKQIDVRAINQPEAPYSVTLTVRPIGGKLEAVDMAVIQIPGGPPVTRTGLSRIPVTDWVRACGSKLTTRVNSQGGGQSIVSANLSDEELQTLRAGNPDGEALRILTRIFRVFRALSDKPTNDLAESIGVTTATMKRWLARAVEAGHLTSEERGRAKTADSSRSVEDVRVFSEKYLKASGADIQARGLPIDEMANWLGGDFKNGG